MPKVSVRVYQGTRGGYRKEESVIGTATENCSLCRHWKKETMEMAGLGEGPCSKDKGARTWGGALCMDFERKRG